MVKKFSSFDMMQWLSDGARNALIEAARLQRCPAGTTIYAQSDTGQEMFRVKSGCVRLSVMGADGRDLLYQLFGPGDCFGTSSLVDGEQRPQTAAAFDAVELQVFDRSIIYSLRQEYPEITDALLKLLSRHMRLLSDYFAGATLDQVSCRLAQRLVDMAETFGVPHDGAVRLSTKISQSELASMVGATRQTVNRVLHDFQTNRWIILRNGEISFVNASALSAAAETGCRLRNFDG